MVDITAFMLSCVVTYIAQRGVISHTDGSSETKFVYVVAILVLSSWKYLCNGIVHFACRQAITIHIIFPKYPLSMLLTHHTC